MDIECKTDEEFKEIFLALLTDSAYAKVITSESAEKKKHTFLDLIWLSTLAEEQQLVPVVIMRCNNKSYFVALCKRTGLTAYFPRRQTSC